MDARRLCGTDVRRSGVWPDDSARADGLAQRHGGTIAIYPVSTWMMAAEWRSTDGQVVTGYGETAADAMQQLSEHWGSA